MARHDTSKEEQKNRALIRAIAEAGGAAELARYLGIKVQAISGWTVCPPLRAGKVAAAAQARGGKTTAADLCPEYARIFAPKPAGRRKEAEATT
jgi:DNA-binding transcriptional regulator YdaS (Cro superfamily)